MSDERPAASRAVFFGVAALVSLGTLGLALFLGAWAFAYRRDSLHAGRLSRMLEERPTEARLSAGLSTEGIGLVASDASDATLERLLGPQAAARAGEVRAEAGPLPRRAPLRDARPRLRRVLRRRRQGRRRRPPEALSASTRVD